MTDPQPTPREEAALRRLLRRARHDDPVPRDVAARLEGSLAGLSPSEVDRDGGTPGTRATGQSGPTGRTGQTGRTGAGEVGVLGAAHRRRRRATALRVAAVGVVVVGIGIGQVVRPAAQNESSGSSPAAADGLARDTPPDRAGGRAESDASGPAEAESARPDGPSSLRDRRYDVLPEGRLALAADPPRVSQARFARDVRAVRRAQRGERDRRSAAPTDRAAPAPSATFTCDSIDRGPGVGVAVRYEQAPAVLVLRPATRDTQVADLVECSSGDVLRSVTLPR